MNIATDNPKKQGSRLGRLPSVLPPPRREIRARFRVIEFVNRSGTTSWRVQGQVPGGDYIRENYADQRAAECRRLELDTAASATLAQQPLAMPKMTTLGTEELRLAETAFERLALLEAQPSDILDAISHWGRTGRAKAAMEVPRLDDAVAQYIAAMDTDPALSGLRHSSKVNMAQRIRLFRDGAENVRVDAITADFIEGYLAQRKVSLETKVNDKKAITRFLGWCLDRPRRWIGHNVGRDVRLPKRTPHVPAILTMDEVERLLKHAQEFRGGRFVPFIVLQLFGGLRPTEAARLLWDQINFDDGEIRIEGHQSKTGRVRHVPLNGTLRAWLEAYRQESGPVQPPCGEYRYTELRKLADINPIPDLLRHTAISHNFRKTGSYGLTAEWAGNSEKIIKAHYQGRVTSQETERFYALRPNSTQEASR